MNIKCMVAGTNASGEPDLTFVIIECTERQYLGGEHYDQAKEYAEDEGYEKPFVAFDENDYAGKALAQLFEWDTTDTISVTSV